VILITTKTGKAGASYIQVETKLGYVALLPRYNTVRSDKYIALGWEGLYNQGVITNEADPTAYANTNLFLPKGLGGNQYNSWNVANGSEN
jgi:hypothetical protein